MSHRSLLPLCIGTITSVLLCLSGCNNESKNLVGTWYEWDLFYPDGFLPQGFAVQFNEDSTGVMWVHDHFKASPKFKPDTFIWTQTTEGQLTYHLTDSSSWNAMDNSQDAHYIIDERGVLNWLGHELKQRR